MSGAEDFPIIGIGASAGGIEALEGFLRGLPPEIGLALVVVTHLSPNRESLLHEIIARYTSMKVMVAADGMGVESDHIYVMPADTILTIENRQLQLRKNAASPERKPVDIFLSSLAVDLGELAGGVILSGGDGDGTLGIKAIKERGGITLAQVADGFGPQHSDMPDSAIASGLVDFAVPAEEMGARLADFVRAVGVQRSHEEQTVDAALPEIYGILRNQIGHDFSGYKSKTFMRRVQRRMQVSQLNTVEGYVKKLRAEPQEVGALFRDLLINVTDFFRDQDAFETLAAVVIPKLFEGRGADDIVRIWVPGCATGEEVFSIGILVREHLEKLTAQPRVQIFATDIDERALAIARAARYPGPLLENVPQERRKRFFIADGGSYVVSKDVRELCIFSPHSVIRDPPFSRIDMVSCRNLLIYFGAEVQSQVIPTLHYALRPDGYLFLGSAENVTQFEDLFAPIDKRHKIFRRRSDVVPAIRVPGLFLGLRPDRKPELSARRPALAGVALRQAVDEQVLERFSPPHVVVNNDGDVVYYSARTGKYLETPAGVPTRQLLTMARRGLRLDLRTLFREAVETGRTVTREGISVESDDDGVQIVSLTIEPLGDRAAGEPLFLVLFADQGPVISKDEALSRAEAMQYGAAAHTERELRETRDRLQSTIEEYETALEELKSSNEELVSVNEEMQSTNEELEASKEELQSVNEELHTVNAELNGKIEALDRANSDLQNLFQSTDVATVFLDPRLVIRSFTPAVAKIFSILPTDRGRPITDLSSKLDLDGFAADIRKVFSEGTSLETQAESEDRGNSYLVRLAPYHGVEQRIEGVVVTFIDVTTLTRAEARQKLLVAELQHRTRDLLAVVHSIAQQTITKGGTPEAFFARLSALGRVQSLVSDAAGNHIDIRDIIRLELQALGASDDKVSISGPPVPLGFEPVQSFALALHELATNAMKHGALKQDAGRLNLTWFVQRNGQDDPVLVLDWREAGVPGLSKPTWRGVGLDLIEKALAFTLRARTNLSFGHEGLWCHIEMPLPAPAPPETV
jgi:two-component system CheB/CheR fusion protein